MKQLILLILLALCFTSASATHLRGGYITFKKDTTATQNPRKLFFTMTLLTDGESQADDPQVIILMGDGNEIVVPRESSIRIHHTNDREVFKWEYTYGSDGTYTVSWNGINRNAGILNITPPSDQLTFSIRTTLTINSLRGLNSSPKFLAPNAIAANIGVALNYNLLAYDPDGDSLTYRLVTPLRSDLSGNVSTVPGYTLPGNTFKCTTSTGTSESAFTIDSNTGQLIWDAPCRRGEYTIAVIIEEWKVNAGGQPVRLSEIFYDMQILTYDAQETIMLANQDKLRFTPEGYIDHKINKEVVLDIHFAGLTPANATLYAGELTQVYKTPVTFTLKATTDGTIGTFRFTPTEKLIRDRPYFISFCGDNSYKRLTTSVGIRIRSEEPLFQIIDEPTLAKTPEGHIVAIAERATKYTMFAEDIPNHVLTLSVESELAAAAKRFDFSVRDTTYGKVGELIFEPSKIQLNEAPQTITLKATYNPARMAGERASYAGEPIVKEMQVQVIVAQKLPTATPEELAAATYLIYPNPAQDKFTVQAETPATLSIYSLQGKLLLEQQLQPGTTEIRRPNTATSGLYFYSLTTKNGHKKNRKACVAVAVQAFRFHSTINYSL